MPAPGTNLQSSQSVTARVMVGGWCPSSTIHLSAFETFLQTGTLKEAPLAETLHQALHIGSIQRVGAPMTSLIITTIEGIEIWYGADGLYICSMVQSSINEGRAALRVFIEQRWIPLLEALPFHADFPQTATLLSEQLTVVHITTDHPSGFELPSSFGGSAILLQQQNLIIQQTKEYQFIITALGNQDDGWWLGQWWLFTLSFQSFQIRSWTDLQQQQQTLQALESRRHIPMTKVSAIRPRLAAAQAVASSYLNTLPYFTACIDRRLATLTDIDITNLIEPPGIWSADARQSQRYLVAQWNNLAERLNSWQHSLDAIQYQSNALNISLLRAIVTLLVTGLFLDWLQQAILPDASVGWLAGTTIVLAVGLSCHLLISLFYRRQNYRILDRRPLLPTNKTNSTRHRPH